MLPFVSVLKLGKKFNIYHTGNLRPTTIRESFQEWLNTIFNFLKKGFDYQSNTKKEVFWALRNASFNLTSGDKLGVIGSNGSGKSTLLKLLSRIYTPSEGSITFQGRISGILEVGTGFHPELTGKENIFLNGAILGMKKKEIYKKFDEIVKFAEIDKFLDTPVKRYSSGMYMKLAFSIAIHLDNEILILDEVFAVGDHKFQKKCFDKIKNLKKEKILIFVSHDMKAISKICNKCLYMKNGKIVSISTDVNAQIKKFTSADS
jgi:lipopolysaccharide transport system ATP-binding protein